MSQIQQGKVSYDGENPLNGLI